MGDLNSWVSDKLHELVGISDRSIAEFMVGLCKKSKSPSEFVEKIRDTGTIDVDEKVTFTHIFLSLYSIIVLFSFFFQPFPTQLVLSVLF